MKKLNIQERYLKWALQIEKSSQKILKKLKLLKYATFEIDQRILSSSLKVEMIGYKYNFLCS